MGDTPPEATDEYGDGHVTTLARLVVRHRWWVIAAWIVVALCGAFGASRATSALSYDFSLPGQSGYETNADITREFGSGGDNAPVLVVSKAAPGGSVMDEACVAAADAHNMVVARTDVRLFHH